MEGIEQTEPQTEPTQEWESESWVQGVLAAANINIEDAESYADWFINTRATLEAERTRVQLQHEKRLQQIAARENTLDYMHREKITALVAMLIAKQGGKKKSIDLPSGRAGFRVSPVTAEYADISAVKTFAEKNPDAAGVYFEDTKVVPRVDKKALKIAIDEYAAAHEGEMPHGMTLKGGQERFYVDAP